MKIEFCLIGSDPLPKQSFRYKKGGGYISPRIAAWQNDVGWQAKIALAGRKKLEGFLGAEIWFVRKTHRRCDVDNMSKAVLDAMQGVIYEDDDRVLDLILHKRYGKTPGIYVRVWEIENLKSINIEEIDRENQKSENL